MTTPAAPAAPDAESFTLRVDGVTAIAPAMAVVLCLEDADREAGVQEFHDAAVDALGTALTHYRANEMARRARVTARTRTMLGTWLARPSPGKTYYLEYYGADDGAGVTGAGVSINLSPRSVRLWPAAKREQWFATWQQMYERGADVAAMAPCTILRLSLPLDHPLAEPSALREWLTGLRTLSAGRLASGYAGYALNYDGSISDPDVEQQIADRLGAHCLRHPGFDWQNAYYVLNRLLPYDPALRDFRPLLKRVNWLSIVAGRSVQVLGGFDQVSARLGERADVRVERTAGGDLLVQAGNAPSIGDTARGDAIPAYCAVARVVRPVRLDTIRGPGYGFSNDRAQEWLDAFDTAVP